VDLIEASKRGNLSLVRDFLTAPPAGRGVNPNIANKFGETPLRWASINGHLEVVKELLFGAKLNITNETISTPLHWDI